MERGARGMGRIGVTYGERSEMYGKDRCHVWREEREVWEG